MQVDFYRLGRSPLAEVVTRIATRIVAAGDRLLVVAPDDVQAAALDEALWAGEDGFLPHGRATATDAGADQPVLIAADCAAAANGARHVALTDGVWREAALGYERVFHFFDTETLDAARAAWRGLATADGVVRNFWSQDEDGRWSKTA